MGAFRVRATGKGDVWAGGQHKHITKICLDDGRHVPKETAIRNIEYGLESYYTTADGQVANVEVVQRCSRCYSKFLRTDRDSTLRDNLLALPDC